MSALFPNPPIKTIPLTPFIVPGGEFVSQCGYGPLKYNGVRWGAGNFGVGLGAFGSQPYPLSVMRSTDVGLTWATIDQSSAPVALDAIEGADIVFDDTNGILHFLCHVTSANPSLGYCAFDLNGPTWGASATTTDQGLYYKLGLRLDGDLLAVSAGGNNIPISYHIISAGSFSGATTLVASGGVHVEYAVVGLLVDDAGTAHILYQKSTVITPPGVTELWHVTLDTSNIIGTPELVATIPNPSAAGIPIQIGQGAIWGDRLEWGAIIDKDVTIYEGTPISAPVWTPKIVTTLADFPAGCRQVFVNPTSTGQCHLFWLDDPGDDVTRQMQYATYDGATFGAPLLAWDAMTNPTSGDPIFGALLQSFSIGVVDGNFEGFAQEFINDAYDTTLVWLRTTAAPSAQVDCSIFIAAAPPPPSITITCGNPPAGRVGDGYSHTFPTTGTTPPDTFTVTAGALPTGLTLGSLTGVIMGVPTLAGTFTFTITVTDSLGATDHVQCSILIAAAPPPPPHPPPPPPNRRNCPGGKPRDDVHPYQAND